MFGSRTEKTLPQGFIYWLAVQLHMSDSPTDESNGPDGQRMLLGPDTIHEEDAGIYLDCPQCGSNVSIERVITKGSCSGVVAGNATETPDDTELESQCTANLSLELVWEA